MWPRRQPNAADDGAAKRDGGATGRPLFAPLKRQQSEAAVSKAAAPGSARPSRKAPTASSVAGTKRPADDSAAWMMRALSKHKTAGKKVSETSKRSRAKTESKTTKEPTAATGGTTKRSKSSKVDRESAFGAGWKQRSAQWKANTKAKASVGPSEQEVEAQRQREMGFELAFQEAFGAKRPQPTATRDHQLQLHEDDEDVPDEEQDQRSIAVPSASSSSANPTTVVASKQTSENNADRASTTNSQDEWSFSTSSGLCLDDFDDSRDNVLDRGDEGVATGAASKVAFARWKEDDASHAVSNNYVKLNMRKRFKGSSGKAKKLPTYLRSRSGGGNEEFDGVQTAKSGSFSKRQQAGGGGSSGIMNDGVDFIEECLEVLAKVERERQSSTVASNESDSAHQSNTTPDQQEEPPTPRCHHALHCQLLTVKKKNQNHGRAFFACPLGMDEGRCDFFLWQDNHSQLALRSLLSSAAGETSNTADDGDHVPLDLSRPIEEQEDALVTNLRLVFGHAEFRPGQQWAITRLFQRQNTLLVLPTGAGKSLCYQFPALFLPGVTIVISPLISLMNDQFEHLPPLLKRQAACLASSSSTSSSSKAKYAEFVRDLLGGKLKLVFLSPEKALGSGMQRLLTQIQSRISLVCVDEAHCISEWSHHFRPSYLRLATVFQHAQCVLAITATASRRVVDDILSQLSLHPNAADNKPKATDMVLQMPWQRSNLQLEVRSVASDEERTTALCRFLATEKIAGGVIIYVHQQRQTEELAAVLREQLPATWNKKIDHYHAKMDAERKEKVRTGFMSGRLRVVIATIAFGMGIDKRNVRCVVHFHMPSSIENYLQQVGRAGRDGKPARAVLFLQREDARMFRSLAFSNALHRRQLEQLVRCVVLAGESTQLSGDLSVANSQIVTASYSCSSRQITQHRLTLDVETTEQLLDMKAAMIETFLTLLAGKQLGVVDDKMLDVALLPTSMARCAVQLVDKQVRSLAQDSIIRRLMNSIEASRPVVRHANVAREVNGYLSTTTLSFHIGEMALALFGGSDGQQSEDGVDIIAVGERRLLQLIRQAQLDGHIQRVTLERPAFHVQVTWRSTATVEEKERIANVVVSDLYAQHERMEALQLVRLEKLFAALDAAAVTVNEGKGVNDGGDDDDDSCEDKEQVLEQKLSEYFDEEDKAVRDMQLASETSDHQLLATVLQPLTLSMVEAVEQDVRRLIRLQRTDIDPSEGDDAASLDLPPSLPWTCYSVAKVFHGLTSPAFPARKWRDHECWRKYDAVAFEKLVRIAEKVVSEDETTETQVSTK